MTECSFKILITVNAAWNVLNFRRAILTSLLADGHEVIVFAPYDESVDELERMGVRFLPLEMNVKGRNPIDDWMLLNQFKRVFGRELPDIVLSYTIKNNIFGGIAAQKFGIPFLPNVSGLGTAFLSGKVLRAIAERLYRKAFDQVPAVFFQNEDDQALFLSRRLVRNEQAKLLPGSGINLTDFASAEMTLRSDRPVFLLVARMLRDKGIMEFVEAARNVKSQYPEACFQLLGAVGAQNRTAIDRETIRRWEDEGIVQYLGTAPDVRPFIKAAHCVVLPSYREGAPRTLIEASAMSRPVIATDVPGCRSVVSHDVTGFLCRARDSESLARAMHRFIELPHEQKKALGVAGRLKMEHEFDEAHVVAAYRKTIASAIGAANKVGLM